MQKSLVGTVAKTKVYFVQSFDGFRPVCVWDGTNFENIGQHAPTNAFPEENEALFSLAAKVCRELRIERKWIDLA